MLTHTQHTMSPGTWYRAGVLALVLALFLVFQVSAADTSGSGSDADQLSLLPVQSDLQKVTANHSVKATIAPIQTKEPDVKPLVESPSPGQTPSLSPTGTPGTLHRPAATPVPIATTDSSAETYYQWGLAYEKSGNYSAAVENFDRATSKDPSYADAWYHKALSYEKLGMWDDAYEAYRLLVAMDPGYTPADKNANLTGIKQNITLNSLPPDVLQNPPPPRSVDVYWFIAGGLLAAGFFGGILVVVIRHRRHGLEYIKAPGQTSLPPPDLDALAEQIRPYYTGDPLVLKTIMKISIEIAREGREGKPLGTAFILGDSEAVLERSRQLILNPLAGHSEEERSIMNTDMRENLKELALVDGAFVVRESGVVEAAGRYISIDTSNVHLQRGLGTRHVSVAAITQETDALGIVISESGGAVRVFSKGNLILETV